MKTWIFLLLISLSCTKMTQKQIEVISVTSATKNQKVENNLSVGNYISVLIDSEEDFSAINNKMSFGFVCVKDLSSFHLSQEELAQKHIDFDVIELKKIEKNRYQFFINISVLGDNKLIYCRLERPGFILKEGYKSDVFELKIP